MPTLESVIQRFFVKSSGLVHICLDVYIVTDIVQYFMKPFHVIGLGASAGGVEALTEFFANLPAVPNAAFIVVTHLNPNYNSQLTSILSRVTSLPVCKVKNEQEILKNHVYVMPENVLLTVKEGKCLISPRRDTNKINKTIDVFLLSLAEDQKEFAVGIVLSGSGSDGSEGVKKIHGAGGRVFVQDPASASFAMMPSAAIRIDNPEAVENPGKLAKRLPDLLKLKQRPIVGG
ncbi:MAG TPA: chemotaxis protein CheB [Verrucomicrobiae bacterium]|nr:chemotaxis protein CheB [Verrucomicrobiae bacterium]